MNNTADARFRPLQTLFLAAGPIFTVAMVPTVAARFGNPGEVPLIMLVAMAIWSPLFFSIPALILADARDRALPGYPGVVGSVIRGIKLVPNLLAARSPVRVEMAASLAGFVVATLVALPSLQQLPPLI
jgi:hypothetical protein